MRLFNRGGTNWYTKPWVAADKVRFRLLPDDFHMGEMLRSPSEIRKYNQLVGDPVGK